MRCWLTFALCLITITAYAEEVYKPKIVSLTPSMTDIVVDLGAADQLVGASTLDKQRLPILNQLESIGNFGSYSVEKIITLKPDIVLSWSTAITPAERQQFSSLGVNVISRDSQSFEALANDIVYIGKQIGKEQQAKQLAAQLLHELLQLKTQYYREKPLTVFYQLWGSPIYTIGKKQIINEVLNTCGAKNIFDDSDLSAPQVNIETVLARNPDIIIAADQSLLDDWQALPVLTAVKNKKLILFQDDRLARPSMGMVEAIKQLCIQINN